ncbi:MAG: KH domain-containing protein, partial [Candidatus Nanohaloarchaea archaeon]
DIGDMLVAKVKGVTKGMDVKLSMEHENARELSGGRVITVAPAKVPRIIGSKGTMVELLKEATDTEIVIGQNGRVYIDGANESLAADAVRKIADEAHTDNLTKRMKDWLRDNGGAI